MASANIWIPPEIFKEEIDTRSIASASDAGNIEQERALVEKGYDNAYSINDHLHDNLKKFDELKKDEELLTAAGYEGRVLLRKPTGSKIRHWCLDPRYYMQLQPVVDLDALASLLRIPDNVAWREMVANVQIDEKVRHRLQLFALLPDDTVERDVEHDLSLLITEVARKLGQLVVNYKASEYGVGGLLARDNYAACGITDFSYIDLDTGRTLFITEIKQAISFPDGDIWYRKTRAFQCLAAMYFTNLPLLLASQRQFRVVIENTSRNGVFIYPGDYLENGQVNSEDFIAVITLLLLSPWTPALDVVPRIKLATAKKAGATRKRKTKKELSPKKRSRSARKSNRRKPGKRGSKAAKDEAEIEQGTSSSEFEDIEEEVDEYSELFFLPKEIITEVLTAEHEVETDYSEGDEEGYEPLFSASKAGDIDAEDHFKAMEKP